ncbi:MAG TPA: SpoIIE family protein phosphatase [Candidatus Rubrimentiphilum sp.]|nr:SpoIIE family protein phosphatase [Candidatus Rubrimentiphilum sp.]
MLDHGELSHTQALELLAEASRLLASSFELSATLPRLAALCVDRLAEYCVIAGCQDEDDAFFYEAGQGKKLRMRRDGAEIEGALRARGFHHVLVLPMRGRESVFGTLFLASRHTGAFSDTSRRLAEILSVLIANALDQASLFEHTHQVADRLQRALLPGSFPRVPGGQLDAAYRPASEEAEVGGDWYDAFELPDHRIAISMGDVAGHGLEAATIMGEVRIALRAAAVGERSPAAVLEQINSVTNLRGEIGMVTAIFGYYDPATRELTYAVAGHPAPALIVAGGFAGFLPGGGLPLGIGTTIDTHDWVVTLPPRSWVLFYTDGMTEYERDIITGEARFLEASVRACESDPENPAIALQERIFSSSINRDDAATLALSCFDGPVPARMEFSAVPLTAPIARAMVQRFCDEHGINDEQRFALIAAIGEAVANACEHAYHGSEKGRFELRLRADRDHIAVDVEDYGQWRPFQRRDDRGRGMVLMHELMDRVRLTSAKQGTCLSMVLNR